VWFNASPGKKLATPYFEKEKSQKRVGEVAQGVGPEFKPQNCPPQKN
jgi:hypothetical protein